MGLLERLKLSLSRPGMELTLELDEQHTALPGALLTGRVQLKGGAVEQRCDRVTVRAHRTVHFAGRELFHEAHIKAYGALWLGPGDGHELEFALRLPLDDRYADDEIVLTAHADVPGALRPEAELSFMLRPLPRAVRPGALRLRGGAAARLARF